MTRTAPPTTESDVRIARVHLRLGQLTLARAELEDLNRRVLLDTASLAILAEARWRTGEVATAADAAQAHIDAGAGNLAQVGDTLDADGVQLAGIARLIFELRHQGQAHPVVQALFQFHDRRRIPGGGAPQQTAGAHFHLRHTVQDVGRIDPVGQAGGGQGGGRQT